jgi:hypothetical protein
MPPLLELLQDLDLTFSLAETKEAAEARRKAAHGDAQKQFEDRDKGYGTNSGSSGGGSASGQGSASTQNAGQGRST